MQKGSQQFKRKALTQACIAVAGVTDKASVKLLCSFVILFRYSSPCAKLWSVEPFAAAKLRESSPPSVTEAVSRSRKPTLTSDNRSMRSVR